MNRISALNELLKTSPGDCFLHHALGLENLKEGNTEAALASFLRVLEIDETYVGTYYHLAKTYERMQQNEHAIKVYEKGIRIAASQKDMHARNELQMALDDLIM